MQIGIGGMFRGLTLAGSIVVLSACGGGGGGGSSSDGSPLVPNPSNPLSLSFTSDRDSLPLNIQGEAAAIGSPFTAALNVRGSYVPGGGTEGGNCWSASFAIISGHAAGELAQPAGASFDPVTQFQVSLGASWTILLNARDQAGVVTVEVAVPDPDTAVVTCDDDKVEVGARFATTPISYIRSQFQVEVGGAPSGTPSQVVLTRQAPEYLYAQGLNNATQLVVQATVVDEAGQRVPDPAAGVNNLFARIVNDSASAVDDDAVLRSGAETGKLVSARSINGQAQFAIVSGSATGNLLVEIIADRADNDVSNGITQPVRNAVAVPVVRAVASEPLSVETAAALPGAFELTPYVALLSAQGGVPPYTWSLDSGSRLPAGLSLRADGVLTGTPTEVGEGFSFAARVIDDVGASVMQVFTLNIDFSAEALSITTSALPNADVGVFYAAAFGATGGIAPYTWSVTTLPEGLTLNSSRGMISGTPAVAGTYNIVTTASDAQGRSISQNLAIVIDGAGGEQSDVTPPAVAWTIPAKGATSVDVCAAITFRFNEPMDALTVNSGSVSVQIQDGAPVAGGQVSSLDERTFQVIFLDPFGRCDPFEGGGDYELVVANSVRDLAGNQMASEFVSEFTTGSGTGDSDAPVVSFTIPQDLAVDVSPTATLTVVFNEAMDPNSIVPASFAVYRIGAAFGTDIESTLPTAVSVIAESDRRFSFVADDPTTAISSNYFEPGGHYRVVMSTSPRDLASNKIKPLVPQPDDQPDDAPAAWMFEFRAGNQ